MDGVEDEKALEREGKQPLAQFDIELEDTPENREVAGEVCRRLSSAITAGGKNIAFGIGLEGGKVRIRADNLDLIPPGIRSKNKNSSKNSP